MFCNYSCFQKTVHQIINDAQSAEAKILITGLSDTTINLAANLTKDILRSNDYSKCDEEVEHDGRVRVSNWCYQNIAMNLGNMLKAQSELGKTGHFIVTVGTSNRAFTYVENPPIATSSCMFELDQLVIQVMWFPDAIGKEVCYYIIGINFIEENQEIIHAQYRCKLNYSSKLILSDPIIGERSVQTKLVSYIRIPLYQIPLILVTHRNTVVRALKTCFL